MPVGTMPAGELLLSVHAGLVCPSASKSAPRARRPGVGGGGGVLRKACAEPHRAVRSRGGARGSGSRAGSVAPVVDRSAIDPSMPPPPVDVTTGFNCVVNVKIGGEKFRITLDTGAARSVVKKRFAQQLRKSKVTRSEVYGPRPLSRDVFMEGFISGSVSDALTEATQI